jgi:nucleobase:cation symporter-1, NCS1 family
LPIETEPASSEPAAPLENIDDIVAALNASYTEAAATPELASETEKAEEFVEPDVLLEQAAAESSAELPAPIQSSVAIDTEPAAESDPSSSVETVLVTETTRPTTKASALSWSWLALASTPLTLVLAAFLNEAGASLAQSVVLLGSALFLSSTLAAIGAVAAKRGSSSLSIVSRAAFGVWGNYLPGILMLVVKSFWLLALIFITSRMLSPLVVNQPWFALVSEALIFPAEFTAMIFVVSALLLVAGLIAGFGGITLLRATQLSAIVSLAGIAAISYFVVSSYSILDLNQGELLAPDSLIDLGILIFAIFGFAVFSQSGDFARKLDPETPGAKVFFLTFVSSFFVPAVVGVLGLSWLHMAEDPIGSVFTEQTLATVASTAPLWVFILFAVALGVSVLQLISHSLYSLSGSLTALGSSLRPGWSVLIVGMLVLAIVLGSSYLIPVSTLLDWTLELVLVAAVIAASWSGIFLADALSRSRGYHEVSLTREYGFYGRVNIANSLGFVLAAALGLGYLNGVGQLSFWAGYLGDLTPQIYEVAGSHIGVAMAFGLAFLIPVLFGIPKIKKQEQNLLELDQRRQELKEFLDAAE